MSTDAPLHQTMEVESGRCVKVDSDRVPLLVYCCIDIAKTDLHTKNSPFENLQLHHCCAENELEYEQQSGRELGFKNP